MSQYQTTDRFLIEYATIQGLLLPETSEDYLKLIRLAHEFRKAVLYATRMIGEGVDERKILRKLRGILNKAYGDSAYKVAKAIVEGCKFSKSNPRHIKIKKPFIVSEGEASRKGNRNVRFCGEHVLIKYPFDGSYRSLLKDN